MGIMEHLAPHPIWHLYLFGVDMSISGHVLWMWISSAVIFFFLMFSLKKGGGAVPKGLYNLTEVVINMVNDQILVPNLGKKAARLWLPFFCTLFLFIMVNNLLGLVPGSATATSNINVTATLALMIFFLVQGVGAYKHGLFKYVRGWVPSGLPVFISIAMFPLELIGQIAKPFSLAVRLFANMFAGHAVLLVFLNLILLSQSYIVGVFPLAGAVMVSMLEIGFSIIQAFVFVMLSAMYIGEALSSGH